MIKEIRENAKLISRGKRRKNEKGEVSWDEYFSKLKSKNQDHIVDLIKNTDDLSKLTGDDLVKANNAARDSILAHNAALKEQTLSAKASRFMLQSLGTIANTALSWGISMTVSALYELSRVSDTVSQKAHDIGIPFTNTKSDIEGYKERISELQSIISDNRSSVEQVTDARKSLLSIQDELISKFGEEKDVITLVTDAINGQAGALDTLIESQWQAKLNEFNRGRDYQ